MKIKIVINESQKDVYLTGLYNNEPGIYIGNNGHIWIVGRNKKIAGYFSSSMMDFCPVADQTWENYNLADEKIRRYDGDLVLRNIP